MNITLDDPTLTWEDFDKFDAEVDAILVKESLNKGESTGHEFRGNRYTGGIPGEATAAAVRQERVWIDAHAHVESLAGFNEKGVRVLTAGGNSQNISLSPAQGEKIRGLPVVTHYHPAFEVRPATYSAPARVFDAGGLSVQDMYMSSLKGNGEIRAVSTGRTASLKYNGNHFSGDDVPIRKYFEAELRKQQAFSTRVNAGIMNQSQWDAATLAQNQGIAAHFGWTYTETLNK